MAFDISTKRAVETAPITLKNADGTTMKDDSGEPITVSVYGPASRVWQMAYAEQSRKRADRVQNGGGRYTAALEDAKDDQIAFLVAITEKFNGDITHPDARNKGDVPRAIYSDDNLGYIRDHVYGEANSWESFTKASAKG